MGRGALAPERVRRATVLRGGDNEGVGGRVNICSYLPVMHMIPLCGHDLLIAHGLTPTSGHRPPPPSTTSSAPNVVLAPMLSLKDRLLAAEDDFLTALREGGQSIVTFDQHWTSLFEDIQLAEDNGDVDTETLELAHTTAVRLSILSEASVDIINTHNSITCNLMGQLDSLMSELSLSDCPSPSSSPPHTRRSLKRQRGASSDPEVDTRSHKRRRDTNQTSSCSALPRCATSYDRYKLGLISACRLTHESESSTFPIRFMDVRNVETLLPIHSPGQTACATRPIQTSSSPGSYLGSRKRRLSDSDVSTPSKRLFRGPRLHAVSDTYSMVASRQSKYVCAEHEPSAPNPPALVDVQPLNYPDCQRESFYHNLHHSWCSYAFRKCPMRRTTATSHSSNMIRIRYRSSRASMLS